MLDQSAVFSQYEDTAKNGFYSQHLSDVSSKGNGAFTTADVFNKSGALLVRKGVAIDTRIRDKLLQHKLLKPLDQQVSLEHQINANVLTRKFHQLIKKYPDMGEMNDALCFGAEFEKLLQYIDNLNPIITQKLTVLDTQLNHEFEKSLFCAWLSTLTARELGLNTVDMRNAFIASLLHDVGMMHLDPSIVASKRQLTPDEWKTMQAHVIVGKIITDAMPGMSPDVSRAIVEHHETCFGSGYPFAISGYERSILGRIIGMTDSIHAIRVNNFEKEKRTLGDIKSYLQLNSATQSNEVYRALMSIIKTARLKRTRFCPVSSKTAYAKKLEQQASIMADTKQSLDQVYDDLDKQYESGNKQKNLATILSILRRMIATTTESGLLSDDLVVWLNETSNAVNLEENILDELNEVELLINELTWQMRNTMRMLSSYHDLISSKNPSIAKSIMTSIESIQASLEQLNRIPREDDNNSGRTETASVSVGTKV